MVNSWSATPGVAPIFITPSMLTLLSTVPKLIPPLMAWRMFLTNRANRGGDGFSSKKLSTRNFLTSIFKLGEECNDAEGTPVYGT